MSHPPLRFILALSVGATLAPCQTMIEHGSIDARTAAATAGAGKAAATIFGRTGKAVSSSVKASETPSPAPGPRAAASAEPERANPGAVDILPTPPPPVVDFRAIAVGMDRAELVKLAGKPSMSVSGVEASMLVETYWYRVGPDTVTIILRGGKVVSISGAEKLAARQ